MEAASVSGSTRAKASSVPGRTAPYSQSAGGAPVERCARALATQGPYPGATTLLPDPGLILAPELPLGAGVRLSNGAQERA